MLASYLSVRQPIRVASLLQHRKVLWQSMKIATTSLHASSSQYFRQSLYLRVRA